MLIAATRQGDHWEVTLDVGPGEKIEVQWPKAMHPLHVKLALAELLKANITYDGITFHGPGEGPNPFAIVDVADGRRKL